MDNDEAVRLRRAVNRLARSFNSSASDEDLTPTQASVLGVVSGRAPVALAEVARVEGLNPSMTSRVVGALVDRGLITRSAAPDDMRAVLLAVTDRGHAAHVRIKAQRAAVIRRAADGLAPEQHAALIAALPALEALSPPVR